MTNSKHTKKALFSSIVSLLLCFTMLMGATFAWFTDNVSSTGNRILAGDLEVDLVMYDDVAGKYVSIGGDDGDIFSEAGDGVWEPGKTQVVYLGVQNKGNLALKYNILLDIKDNELAGALEYAIIDGATSNDTYADWADVKAKSNGQTEALPTGQVVAAQGGVLDDVADDPSLTGDKGETDFFALAVHMREEAGNEYENKDVTIDIVVNATQKDAEEDSFGSDYDAGAEFETVVFSSEELKNSLTDGADTIRVSAGNYSFPASSLSEGDVIICDENTVFEGTSSLNISGATVVGATFDAGSGNTSATGTVNGTYQDCTFTGGSEGVRWCYTNEGETAVFENCVFDATVRGFHFDEMNGDVYFKNCVINGFNAYGGEGTAHFEGCTFGNGDSNYNGLNIYADTELKNCTFNFISGKTNFIDMEGTGKTLTFTSCKATLDGADANISAFVGGSKLDQNTVIYN